MPFNLLLLPLLGGFIFARQCKRTRYYALRSEGHVLLFYSASCGALFLFVSAFLSYALGSIFSGVDLWWHAVVPIEHSGKSALAGLMAATLWIPLNWGIQDEREIDRVIQVRQDSLELLLRGAMGEGELILLSTRNGKIYVGYVVSNLNPAFPIETLGVLPMMSGYRDSEKKTLKFTTFYDNAYGKMRSDIESEISQRMKDAGTDEVNEMILAEFDEQLNGFNIVFPLSEIQSVAMFKPDIYNKYFLTQDGLAV